MIKQHPEYQYLNLLKELVEKGVVQKDINTGVKTFSKFGVQMRFDLKDSSPFHQTFLVVKSGKLSFKSKRIWTPNLEKVFTPVLISFWTTPFSTSSLRRLRY